MTFTPLASSLDRIFAIGVGVRAAALGSVVAMAAFAPSAQAVVVVSSASNIAVPLTTQGIYVNVVTGVSDPSPSGSPGWDVNPWGSTTSTSALNFFNPTAPTGGVYVVSVAGQVASLSLGTVVGASTPLFGSGQATTTAATSPWVLNATNYFGFRFIGDDTLLHYGYGSMNIGSSLQTRTIGNLWYESTAGAAITVAGITTVPAVPEPSTWAMMLGGLTVAGAVARRRRQTQD